MVERRFHLVHESMFMYYETETNMKCSTVVMMSEMLPESFMFNKTKRMKLEIFNVFEYEKPKMS